MREWRAHRSALIVRYSLAAGGARRFALGLVRPVSFFLARVSQSRAVPCRKSRAGIVYRRRSRVPLYLSTPQFSFDSPRRPDRAPADCGSHPRMPGPAAAKSRVDPNKTPGWQAEPESRRRRRFSSMNKPNRPWAGRPPAGSLVHQGAQCTQSWEKAPLINTKREKQGQEESDMITDIIVTNLTPGFCAYAQLFPFPFFILYHVVPRGNSGSGRFLKFKTAHYQAPPTVVVLGSPPRGQR